MKEGRRGFGGGGRGDKRVEERVEGMRLRKVGV